MCPGPGGRLPPFPCGQPRRSSWKGNCITIEGWALTSTPSGAAFLLSSLLDHCPVSSWAEGLSVFGKEGACSVSLQGLAGSGQERKGDWAPGVDSPCVVGRTLAAGTLPSSCPHGPFMQCHLLSDGFPRALGLWRDSFRGPPWGLLRCPIFTAFSPWGPSPVHSSSSWHSPSFLSPPPLFLPFHSAPSPSTLFHPPYPFLL